MINDKIERVKQKVVNTNMSVASFIDIWQQEFSGFGIEFTSSACPSILTNTASVSGFYDQYEYLEEINIEVVVIVNDTKGFININNDSWNFLRHQMNQTITHEMRHREQTKGRDGFIVSHQIDDSMSEEQKRIVYLSEPDELDAYAGDIVLDLLELYTSQGVASKLASYPSIQRSESPILYEYVSLFGKDSQLVKSIIKKALKMVTS